MKIYAVGGAVAHEPLRADAGDADRVRRRPIAAADIPGIEEFITPLGELRTLPCHWPDPDPRMSGLDGFYAARLERI